MDRARHPSMNWVVLFCLVAPLGCVTTERTARRILSGVEQMVDRELPMGSPQSAVSQFVDAHQWRHNGWVTKGQGIVLKAWVPDAHPPSGKFYCDAYGQVLVTFTLDSDHRLVGKSVDQLDACW